MERQVSYDMDVNGRVRLKSGFVGQKMIVLPKKILSTIKNNPLISHLYITDIGYFPHAEHHFIARKRGSKQYILIYCSKGQGVINVDGTSYQLGPNSYYVIPPNKGHEYHAVKKDPWTIYWVHFSGQLAINMYQKFTRYQKEKVCDISFDKRRLSLFENIMDVLEDGYRSENIEYVNITLWQLLSSFLFFEHYAKIEKNKTNGDFVDRSIDYMKSHMDQPLLVNEIAERLNFSSSHFFSIFKKKTGFSPIQYFNHLKIQRSCQYLSFTDMSIKEISYALGFEDPLYFSRLFRKEMSVPPKQYRSEYKQ